MPHSIPAILREDCLCIPWLHVQTLRWIVHMPYSHRFKWPYPGLTFQIWKILCNHYRWHSDRQTFDYHFLIFWWSLRNKEKRMRTHRHYFQLAGQRTESEQHRFGRGTLRPGRLASLKRKMVSSPFWALNWRWQWNTHLETSWSQLEPTGAQERGKG